MNKKDFKQLIASLLQSTPDQRPPLKAGGTQQTKQEITCCKHLNHLLDHARNQPKPGAQSIMLPSHMIPPMPH